MAKDMWIAPAIKNPKTRKRTVLAETLRKMK